MAEIKRHVSVWAELDNPDATMVKRGEGLELDISQTRPKPGQVGLQGGTRIGTYSVMLPEPQEIVRAIVALYPELDFVQPRRPKCSCGCGCG